MKKIAALLSLFLIISSLFGISVSAEPDGQSEIQNVNLTEDGLLTWDPYEGATRYWIVFGSTASFQPEGTSANLYQKALDNNFPSGTYSFSLVACDDNWANLSLYYYGTFEFVAPIGLDKVTNLRWDGKTARWDSVDGAIGYNVYLYLGSNNIDVEYVEATSLDYSDSILLEKNNDYSFAVMAIAEGDLPNGPLSELSDTIEGWFEFKEIQNVRIENGVLSWDAFEGAERYWLRLGVGAWEPEGTSINLDVLLAESEAESGTYDFNIVACLSNWTDISQHYYGSYDYEKSFTVRFDPEGDSKIDVQVVKEGGKATVPESPAKKNLTFSGWYLDNEPFDFDKEVDSNVVLTARYLCEAEAIVYPAEAGFVYVTSETTPESGSSTVKHFWDEDETGSSYGSFSFKANEKYGFVEWRVGTPDGVPVQNVGKIHTNEDGTEVYFETSDGGYVLYAIFEKIAEDPVVTDAPVTDAPVSDVPVTDNPSTGAPTSDKDPETTNAPDVTDKVKPGKNVDKANDETYSSDKKPNTALIIVFSVLGAAAAAGAVVAVIFIIKKKKGVK